MKLSHFLLSIIFCSQINNLYSQDTYIRPGLSIINIDFNDSKSNLNIQSVESPKNFDFLNINVSNLSVETSSPKKKLLSEIAKSENPLAGLKGESKSSIAERNNKILETFISNKVSNKAVLAAVPIGEDGNYNFQFVLDRGVNTASDQDVNLTSQDMMGDKGSLQDRFLYLTEKAINSNYVIAFNMPNFLSYSDETSYGLEGVIHYFVFKIDNVYDADSGGLIYAESEINNSQIGAKVITSKSFTSTSTNSKDQSLNKKLGILPKSNEELASELQNLLMQKIWEYNLREVDEFKPKTTLKPKNKINLGTKEDLKIDNRFQLYENVLSKSGEIVKKKRAMLRVKKVGVNDGLASGDSDLTKLYKIGYGKSQEGMLVVQEEDKGIGVSVGYGTLSWLRLDYRLKGITPGLMTFIDVHPYPGKVEFTDYFYENGLLGSVASAGSSAGWDISDDFSAFGFNLSLGFEKQTYFSSALYISPFVSGGISNYSISGQIASRTVIFDEKIEWSDEESDIYNAYFVTGGLRVGLQLTNTASINLSIAQSAVVSGGWKDAKIVYSIDDEVIADGWNIGDPTGEGFSEESDQEYIDAFYNTSIDQLPTAPAGLLYNIMLRYEF
jgi:hypothetical protein